MSIWLWIIGLFLVFKLYIKLTTGTFKGNQRLDGKTVIVTGANTGIGYESAKDFAKRGGRVILACRNRQKAENAKHQIITETQNNNVVVKIVDFLSLASVRNCANEILSEEARIDVLLNNAGAYQIGLTKQTDDGLDEMMQSNHFGPFLFTNILLGKIKQSSPSRIVNVSSETHRFAKLDLNHVKKPNAESYFRLYSTTKLCNILFTNELARLLKGTGVTANSLHPGIFASEINRRESFLVNILYKTFSIIFLKSIYESAQTSIYLCVSPDVKYSTGEYYADCKVAPMMNGADNLNVAKKLWEISEEVVNLKPEERHY